MSPNPCPAMRPNLSWRQSPNHRDPIWPARLLIGLVLTILLSGRAFAAEARTFNILHIHADDHRADGLHALGTKELVTPHLDALVARGTTFTRCYTMGSMIGAVCTPSRTMLLTVTGEGGAHELSGWGCGPPPATPRGLCPRSLVRTEPFVNG